MKLRSIYASMLQCAYLLALLYAPLQPAQAQSPVAGIVGAANDLLATLDPQQRQRVLFAFDDERQRARWSNLPQSMFPRAGVGLGELNDRQRAAAMALLASALSPMGLQKVQQIVLSDEVLSQMQGGTPRFGKDLYFFSILGTPSERMPWMLQFGGHHLALNITIAGTAGILTPSFIGAQPALFTLDGKTIRPLGEEGDRALALLNALDAQQRARAILSYRVADVVLGAGQDSKTIQPEGLRAAAMTAPQRAMLRDLIAQWTRIVHAAAADARMQEIEADLEHTWFAWSGPTTAAAGRNVTAYYRIQGPRLVIEYAPQTLGGDPSLHIHTIYRDPSNDYGRRTLRDSPP
jgi:hypothetical protein